MRRVVVVWTSGGRLVCEAEGEVESHPAEQDVHDLVVVISHPGIQTSKPPLAFGCGGEEACEVARGGEVGGAGEGRGGGGRHAQPWQSS